MFSVLIAFGALAIDVGIWLHTKTELQKSVDAMVLGGAQELCGRSDCDIVATTIANGLRIPNGVEATDSVTVDLQKDCGGSNITNHDRITARISRDNPSYLSKVIGLTGATIKACATAGRWALGGFEGIVPFGIEDDCLGLGTFGATYTLKYDSHATTDPGGCGASQGNFGALAVDTSGAGSGCSGGTSTTEELKFKQALCFGANREVCSGFSTDCVGEADDDSCGSEQATATQSCTETGNMTGPVDEGMDYRFDGTSSLCNEWLEVAALPSGLKPECNPWIPDGPASLRVVMIPIIDGLWTEGGRHVVDILGFAVFFIEEYTCNSGGGTCDITGRFIKTQLSTGATGTYTPASGDLTTSLVTITRLVN
jgi:hypothetical protein